jgi:hypothetical protein
MKIIVLRFKYARQFNNTNIKFDIVVGEQLKDLQEIEMAIKEMNPIKVVVPPQTRRSGNTQNTNRGKNKSRSFSKSPRVTP